MVKYSYLKINRNIMYKISKNNTRNEIYFLVLVATTKAKTIKNKYFK